MKKRNQPLSTPSGASAAPEPLLSEADTQSCGALLVDLASRRGMEDPRALWARGLPGKLAPLSSGRLIAQTVCRLWKEEEV